MKLRGDSSLAETAPNAHFAKWEQCFGRRGILLQGKQVLEVGGGRYARLAFRLLASGARQITLVDPYATPIDVPRNRALLEQDCGLLGLASENVLARVTIIQDDIQSLPAPAPGAQVDIVISGATLEHVRDPGLVLSRCRDWLKPGGVTCHIVDLRDHNLSFRYPFEMLTFSDECWERFLDLEGGFHLNRWRAPDYVRAMNQAGFVNVSCEDFLRDEAGALEAMPRLAPGFRGLSMEALAVQGIYLYGEKER